MSNWIPLGHAEWGCFQLASVNKLLQQGLSTKR